VRCAQHIAESEVGDEFEGIVDQREVREISTRLRRFLNHELVACPGRYTRDAVMEEFLGVADVHPHLPKYYPAPKEARVQLQIMDGLWCCLDLVKGMQSHDKLAYRGALLDAAVPKVVHRQGRAIACVLHVWPENIRKASKRRSALESEGVPWNQKEHLSFHYQRGGNVLMFWTQM
jgi:hypothetical protein